MILKPPFQLMGREGAGLDAGLYFLGALGIDDAVLKTRSLGVGELTFSMRAWSGRPVPDNEQWLTLQDANRQTLMVGLAKRTYRWPEKEYSFVVSDVYKGLLEAPFLEGDRAFVLYPEQDLAARLLNILQRGIDLGLPIQAPATMPELYPVPKQAFRARSVGEALEEALKWAPDVGTKMDYTTLPYPTLRFVARRDTAATVIDLDSIHHKVEDVSLTPYPEARALSVTMAYARRDGDDVVLFLTQTAGDDAAEARRKLSVYLSGAERTDNFVTEALTTAQKAVAMAQASVDAVGASIDAAAASAQIPLTWSALLPRDSNLQGAVSAQSGFTMSPGVGTIYLYNGIACASGNPNDYTLVPFSIPGLYLATSGGSPATGWYPIETGAFTAAQLATAGATKETRYIQGSLYAVRTSGGNNAAMNYLETNADPQTTAFTGYTQNYNANCATNSDHWRKYVRYNVNIAVEAINMAPSAVAAAVKAAAASGSSALIERAEFVEAPPNLVQNYFERQDWPVYKGPVRLVPSAWNRPAPGDFLNLRGVDVEPEWLTMKAPVSELETDLQTLAATVTLGPPQRMDFNSLVDRLRIPQEDNYEPG